MVGIHVVLPLPAEIAHGLLGGAPHARRLGADDRMLAVGLVPHRHDVDALFRRQHAGAQLRRGLVRETVAHADGIFRNTNPVCHLNRQ